MLKIIIADQSYIVRKGFSSFIEQFREIEVVDGYENESEFLKCIENDIPDIILLNTSFLSPQGILDFKKYLQSESQVLYIFNTSIPSDSANSHLSILDSKAVLSEKFQDALAKIKGLNDSIDSEELSPREKLILQNVALGLTNKEIAIKLFISTHTVISHRKNITRKLGIKTVSGLTVYAILNNLIQMEDIS